MATLQACAAIVTSQGFQHFELAKDTRLSLDARKGHRFVAINCEHIAKRIIGMSGMPAEVQSEILHAIVDQTRKFRVRQAEDAKEHSASQPGPDGTGTA